MKRALRPVQRRIGDRGEARQPTAARARESTSIAGRGRQRFTTPAVEADGQHSFRGSRLGLVSGRRERKVVIVLFADLAGFTSSAEAMDPEDVAALLDPYHLRLKRELERFGGTVEK